MTTPVSTMTTAVSMRAPIVDPYSSSDDDVICMEVERPNNDGAKKRAVAVEIVKKKEPKTGGVYVETGGEMHGPYPKSSFTVGSLQLGALAQTQFVKCSDELRDAPDRQRQARKDALIEAPKRKFDQKVVSFSRQTIPIVERGILSRLANLVTIHLPGEHKVILGSDAVRVMPMCYHKQTVSNESEIYFRAEGICDGEKSLFVKMKRRHKHEDGEWRDIVQIGVKLARSKKLNIQIKDTQGAGLMHKPQSFHQYSESRASGDEDAWGVSFQPHTEEAETQLAAYNASEAHKRLTDTVNGVLAMNDNCELPDPDEEGY